jgi:hypothetical protein
MALGRDSLLWVLEDKNRTVIRLAEGQNFLMSTARQGRNLDFDDSTTKAFILLRKQLLEPQCGEYHQLQFSGGPNTAIYRLAHSGWLEASISRIGPHAVNPMPPNGELSVENLNIFHKFSNLFVNIMAHYLNNTQSDIV